MKRSLTAHLESGQNSLLKEVAEIRRVQERQTVVLARIETKLEEREKASDEMRGRVHTLEVSDRRRLVSIGKLAGLGGVCGAALIKLLSRLGF